jgi:glycosyltransferase involved in cell wall biosynthesis
MKNVLIISYFWPPSGAVGAIRPAKLAKVLGLHGWKVIIVTVKEQYYEQLNTAAEKTRWTGAVIRTKSFGNPRLLYVWIKSKFFRLAGRENEFKASVLRGSRDNRGGVKSDSFLSGSKRFFLSLLHIPDEQQGWLSFAIASCLRALKSHSIKCVISTGPPFTSHLVGLFLKKVAGVRWVVEFRDPWSGNEQQPSIVRSTFSDFLNRKLEAAVIRNADRVVCVTPAMTNHYRRFYPNFAPEKWVTITNGFEKQDFKDLGHVSRHQKFTISYLGSLIYARSPECLFRAVGELVEAEAIPLGDIAIRFIGKCRYAEGRAVEEMAAEHGLKDIVEIVDFLPRRDALKEMLRAHVLLLLATQQVLQVPGKAYEYLGAGGKILAVTEEKGATADFINQIGGCVAAPDHYMTIKRIIKTWYDDHKRKGCLSETESWAEPSVMDQYEWRQLGQQYVDLLNSCCGHIDRDTEPILL